MLTSLGSGNEALLAYDSGIEAYLTKPVRQAELVEALGRVLQTESPGAPPILTVAPGRRARVLIVEDNAVNQEVARAMLAELGCSIRVAADGREALAVLRDDTFDLIFLDCQLPEMDGFEAVRRFRASAAAGYATRGDVPIVALTANALAGDAERCIAAGFDVYLAKPGFKDYREYAWLDRGRFDYTPADVEEFCEAIAEVVVPANERRLERQRQLLGYETLRPWDTAVDPLGREPLKPYTSISEWVDRSETIFQQLDPELGVYFSTMKNEKLLDLDNRKGKRPGGYCTYFPVSKRPFIFMNAVGLDGDVRTLLHEAGHAFHSMSARAVYQMQRRSPMEFNEVASMAMELLASPYLTADNGGFYSQADAARALGKVLDDVMGAIAISPDGGRIAFNRVYQESGEFAILVADADGSGERIIGSHAGKLWLQGEPAWSPDGTHIATGLGKWEGGYHYAFVTLRVADGKETTVSDYTWTRLPAVRWLPDGSTLVVNASDQGSWSGQLWQIIAATGRAIRVTNDLTSYASLSLTGDGKTICTVQMDGTSNIFVLPLATVPGSGPPRGSSARCAGTSTTPRGAIPYGRCRRARRSMICRPTGPVPTAPAIASSSWC